MARNGELSRPAKPYLAWRAVIILAQRAQLSPGEQAQNLGLSLEFDPSDAQNPSHSPIDP
ncbi:hypothetical protein A2U01_0051653 [Trifolium medium]|uniref:Uncharacterized protein n=1 Tax=Trifolium medium TaxID=97028 RepID=A0A392R2X1_9FABA|nr:hypothetical protein [Trifolium medium]